MPNLSMNLNLLKFKNAAVVELKGSTATKKCLVIPIEDNCLFVGESGVYFNAVAWRNSKLQDGKTHLIKQSFKKELIEMMSDDERKALPVFGDIKEFGGLSSELANASEYSLAVDVNEGGNSDLPF